MTDQRTQHQGGGHASRNSIVAKKGKQPKRLGPSTVAKPCVIGASVLLVIQTAMRVLLKA